MKHFRSVVSLLMVFVLCFGMIPCAFADEITTPTAPQSGEGSASEAVPPNTDQTPPPEESAAPPEESTEPPSEEATEPMEEDPTDETTLPEELDDLDSDDRLLGAEAYASTQKSIMLFDFADNGDYTTRLNYQVTCAYKPNGSGTTRTAYVKNMGWHFARYGGVAHADEPLYCIEPWRNYAASTSGNSVDRDVTLNGSGSTTGSNVWYALPSARREAIGLILLYSDQQWNHSISVTSVKKDSNPNVPLRVATQILIYEIVCGLRDPSSFNRNSSNECGTSGDVFYAAASASVSGFSSCYHSLVSAIQSAKTIPSFCGSSSSNAPTIQLSGNTGSAYDSNGVLSNFSFSNGNGARFSKSGKHFTEDLLLSSMETAGTKDMPEDAERKGLGTPATRAGILEKLVSTGMVERRKAKKQTILIPTALGNALITVLPEQLQSPLLTAEWENRLSQVQKGELEPEDFLDGIQGMLTDLVRDYRPVSGADILFPSAENTVGKCPRCGRPVIERSKGYFCTNKDCKFVLWRDSRFFTLKQKTLDRKTAQLLLEKGRAPLKGCVSSKTGKVYDAAVVLEDDGDRVRFKLVFGNG